MIYILIFVEGLDRPKTKRMNPLGHAEAVIPLILQFSIPFFKMATSLSLSLFFSVSPSTPLALAAVAGAVGQE